MTEICGRRGEGFAFSLKQPARQSRAAGGRDCPSALLEGVAPPGGCSVALQPRIAAGKKRGKAKNNINFRSWNSSNSRKTRFPVNTRMLFQKSPGLQQEERLNVNSNRQVKVFPQLLLRTP